MSHPTTWSFTIVLWTRIFAGALLLYFMSGMFAGYPALKPIFIDAGVYENYCTPLNASRQVVTTTNAHHPDTWYNDEDVYSWDDKISFAHTHVKNSTAQPKCDKQRLRMNTIAQVATAMANGSAIILGLIVDLANARLVMAVSSIIWGLSYALFGVSGPHFDFFIAGATLATAMGALLFLSLLKLARFANSPIMATMIVSLFTSMWDLSALNAWLFNVIYFHTKLTMRSMFGWYSVLAIPAVIFAIVHSPFKFELENTDEEEAQSLVGKEVETSFKERMYQFLSDLFQSILSFETISIYIMLTMSILSMYFYLTTVSDQLLQFTTDPKKLANLILALSILLPVAGTIASLVLGRLKGAMGPELAFLLLTALNATWTVTSIIPSANLQYFTFVVCVSWRIAVFIFASDHIISKYPMSCSFTVYSTGLTIAGLTTLSSPIWNHLVEKRFDGNFMVVNIVIGVLNISASLLATVAIALAERRRRAEKQIQTSVQ